MVDAYTQGYIHSRLAILETLLNKHLTRRKNTSYNARQGVSQGRKLYTQTDLSYPGKVFLYLISGQKDCLTLLRCLTSLRCLPLLCSGRHMLRFVRQFRSVRQPVLLPYDCGKKNLLVKLVHVSAPSQGNTLSGSRNYYSYMRVQALNLLLKFLIIFN